MSELGVGLVCEWPDVSALAGSDGVCCPIVKSGGLVEGAVGADVEEGFGDVGCGGDSRG